MSQSNITISNASKLFLLLMVFALHSCVSNREYLKRDRGTHANRVQIKEHAKTGLKQAEEIPGAPPFVFPVGPYLWVFYSDRIVIHSGPKKTLTHDYKSFKITPCPAYVPPSNGFNLFEGSSGCVPSADIYSRNPLERRHKIDIVGDELVLNFTDRREPEYVFQKDGKFLRKQSARKKILLGQDRRLVVIKKTKRRESAYFTGKSVNELFRISDYFSLEDWLLLEEKMKVFGSDPETFKYKGTKIHLVFRKGGYIVKTLENPDGRYLIREYGEGFYIDKLDEEKKMRPYLWFGKKIIQLGSKENYCYVKNERRMCVQDKAKKIRGVFHNAFYRVFFVRPEAKTTIYIEWLNK